MNSPSSPVAAEERRRGQLGAQHLASIMNNPHEATEGWGSWTFTGALGVALGLYPDESPDAAPPLPPGLIRDVAMEDFEGYLRKLQTAYPRFVASREASIAQQTSRTANPTTGERPVLLKSCPALLPSSFRAWA